MLSDVWTIRWYNDDDGDGWMGNIKIYVNAFHHRHRWTDQQSLDRPSTDRTNVFSRLFILFPIKARQMKLLPRDPICYNIAFWMHFIKTWLLPAVNRFRIAVKFVKLFAVCVTDDIALHRPLFAWQHSLTVRYGAVRWPGNYSQSRDVRSALPKMGVTYAHAK